MVMLKTLTGKNRVVWKNKTARLKLGVCCMCNAILTDQDLYVDFYRELLLLTLNAGFSHCSRVDHSKR